MGSEAKGFARFSSTINTGNTAFGSVAQGHTNSGSIISTGTGAFGSIAIGNASSSGIISTGDSAIGSEAKGSSNLSSIISTGVSAFGSTAQGYTNSGSIISTGSGARGSLAMGSAENSTSIIVNGIGSIAVGQVTRTGEVNQITRDGSFLFGRNSAVTEAYSGAIGQNALAYLPGSFAHSSFEVPYTVSGSRVGALENIKVMASLSTSGPTSSGLVRLSDGSFPRLPYIGSALVDVDIIGNRNSASKMCFFVSNSGGNYAVRLPTNPSGGVSCFISPAVGALIVTAVPLTTSGFTINIATNASGAQNFGLYFDITAIKF